ncbi:hypothetical protein BDV93DRAFT_71602 [Ceratobasidium sp. AG-I]|nr:hypothetical protein BDV93DRAFT_71602 [Ceratobasidium sp. AG-I]
MQSQKQVNSPCNLSSAILPWLVPHLPPRRNRHVSHTSPAAPFALQPSLTSAHTSTPTQPAFQLCRASNVRCEPSQKYTDEFTSGTCLVVCLESCLHGSTTRSPYATQRRELARPRHRHTRLPPSVPPRIMVSLLVLGFGRTRRSSHTAVCTVDTYAYTVLQDSQPASHPSRLLLFTRLDSGLSTGRPVRNSLNLFSALHYSKARLLSYAPPCSAFIANLRRSPHNHIPTFVNYAPTRARIQIHSSIPTA